MTADPQAIRERAHQIWEMRGRRDGCALEDWLEAERQLSGVVVPSKAVDESLQQTFPASDPPASHLPDEPPVNAQAKWEAAEKAERRHSEAANRPRARDDSEKNQARMPSERRKPGSRGVVR